MLLGEDVLYVICEWWEDYIIGRSSGTELVSVKHREPSKGAWSMASLVEDGGVRHLYERWVAHKEQPRCRLQTNAGLTTSSAKNGASAAAVLAATEASGAIEATVKQDLSARLGCDTDTAERFIRSLTIEAELPKRDDLIPRLIVHFLEPRCSELGWTSSEVRKRFLAIRNLVFETAQQDLLAISRDPSANSKDDYVARAEKLKRITPEMVVEVMGEFVAGRSKMVQKLHAGGFGPTDIESCKRLRAKWAAFARQWDPGLPGSSQVVASILEETHNFAVKAEQQTDTANLPYGEAMRAAFLNLVESRQSTIDGLTAELILGAAYDETDRCSIWWSPVDALPTAES